ncbi:hypothetical protein HHE94_06730 [Pseudoalteromonas arctica]|uniref:Uncharacterized protein n=1 Tax=Pseudoalteromonas arctica TaxID=394751 RepID=A0AAP6Y1Y5_9GAMM|nr:hypothetical protein [Pseudoalteromonas arctica]NMP02415.1 hypothetical protein [Pseudoalteromonas arctica]
MAEYKCFFSKVMIKTCSLFKEVIMPKAFHFLRVTKEFFITILFSLSPILLSALVIASFTDKDFLGAVKENFKSGEVFIYTAAFLAPYIVNRLSEGTKGIFKELIFYIFWAVLLSGAYIFILIRIETLLNNTLRIEATTLSFVSNAVILLTAFIWYYSVWPNHHKTQTPPYKQNEKDMTDLNKALDKKLGG